jgi:hypothetical protein
MHQSKLRKPNPSVGNNGMKLKTKDKLNKKNDNFVVSKYHLLTLSFFLSRGDIEIWELCTLPRLLPVQDCFAPILRLLSKTHDAGQQP